MRFVVVDDDDTKNAVSCHLNELISVCFDCVVAVEYRH